jgi:hypothetical protein
MPLFISQAFAAALSGHHGLVLWVTGLYSVGRIHYSLNYGKSGPLARIPGLIISDILGLNALRGTLLLQIVRHLMK